MKKMKKIFALVIAMVMVIAMAVPAMAASIEITHDSTYEAGGGTARVYNAYKVFDVDNTSLSGENTQAAKDDFTYTPDGAAVAYSMATNSPWLSVMQDTTNQTWFDVKLAADGSKYVVTPKKDGSGNSLYSTEAHAKAFAEYLEGNIPEAATATTVTVDAEAATVDPGYYLIVAKDDKDAATKIALVTTNVKMVEKNTYLKTGKTTAQTSYSVGDIVNYTATVEIPLDAALTKLKEGSTTEYVDGHGPIILHDTMTSTLTFKDDVAATVDGTEFTGYTKNYTANASAANGATAQADGCTFELVVPVTSALLGKTITFTYSAEVNSSAADPDTGFVNTFIGENNGYKTTPDSPQVYTFDFDFSKEFVGSTDTNLKATFELRTTANDATTAISFIAGSGVGKYIKADSNDTGASKVIESANNAAINVDGLKAGTYYLVELSTSTGYNLLDGPVPVVITDTSTKNSAGEITAISHTVTIDGKASTEASPAKIQNNAGTVLPSTGGIGTTIFYIVGAILVIGAGVVLVTRRRMNAD